MPGSELWFPEPMWKDQPCYIVGGGSSLTDFPWEALRRKNVIGCNAAFYLGVKYIPIAIFGDCEFLSQHLPGLKHYADAGGWIVTPTRPKEKSIPPELKLKIMKKQVFGLGKDCLGWNGNTGASAINLALLFGANPIYLLGYDMKLSQSGEGNFHDAYSRTSSSLTYNRFLRGMKHLAKDLPKVFPGRKVINLEDNTSVLNEFPKQSLKDHFSERMVEV